MRIVLAALMLVAATAVSVSADEPRAESDANQIEGPRLTSDGLWAGSMVIIVGGLFLSAAVLGPIIRANNPQDVPKSAHDEPPGSSHHHGPSGTRL